MWLLLFPQGVLLLIGGRSTVVKGAIFTYAIILREDSFPIRPPAFRIMPTASSYISIVFTAAVAKPIKLLTDRNLHLSRLLGDSSPTTRHSMLLNLFSIFLCLCSLSSAARLTISIPSGSPALPNAGTLPSSTHAVLTGPPGIRYDAPLRRDNTFIFPDLGDASYLLAVYSRDYFFPPLRVDVQQAGDDSSKQSIHVWQTFRGNEWGNKGPLFGSGTGELTISIAPSTRKDFYLPRGGFNLVGFLKNPMILMALVSVVFIFGVPYMMDNSASTVDCSPKVLAELWLTIGSGPRDACGVRGDAKKEPAHWLARCCWSGAEFRPRGLPGREKHKYGQRLIRVWEKTMKPNRCNLNNFGIISFYFKL